MTENVCKKIEKLFKYYVGPRAFFLAEQISTISMCLVEGIIARKNNQVLSLCCLPLCVLNAQHVGIAVIALATTTTTTTRSSSSYRAELSRSVPTAFPRSLPKAFPLLMVRSKSRVLNSFECGSCKERGGLRCARARVVLRNNFAEE